MRESDLSGDRSGKEAFAYLSIILVVFSSGYLSYMAHLQMQDVRESMETDELNRITDGLVSIGEDIELTLIDMHDMIFLEIASNTSSWKSTRMDSELEGRLIESIFQLLEEKVEMLNGSAPGCRFALEDISVSVTPLIISHMMPTSGVSGSRPNGTGTWTYGWRPGSMGTNTTIDLNIIAFSDDGSLSTSRKIETRIERSSITDILVNRLVRLEKALTGNELSEIFQHTVSSLARTKAFLGSGRASISGMEEKIPDLLTPEEIKGCLDLSVHLLSRAYLGSLDLDGLQSVDNLLRSVRGSFGCSPSMIEMIDHHEGSVDPALLVLISEGLFSEKYPPTVDEMLRPLLLSILERMVLDLVNYLGIDSGMMEVFGGSFNLFLRSTQWFDELTETIFGRKMIDKRDDAVRDLIRAFYSLEPSLDQHQGKVFLDSIPGKKWDGKVIKGYPEIDLEPFSRNFSINILEGPDEENGIFFSVYNVSAIFDPPSIDPFFHDIDLLGNETIIEGISSVLGVDEGYISTELHFKEQMEFALRHSIEDLIEDISNEGKNTWGTIWKGWGYDSYPALDEAMEPTSFLVGLSLGSVPDIVSELGPRILEDLEWFGLLDIAKTTMGALGGSIVGWIDENYLNITHKDQQIELARCTMLTEISNNTRVEILSSSFSHTVELDVSDLSTFGIVHDGVDEALSDPFFLFTSAFNMSEGEISDPFLENVILSNLEVSFNEVMERELGTGFGVHDIGLIRKAFQTTITRGYSPLPFTLLWDGGNSSIEEYVKDILTSVIGGIIGDFTGEESFTRSRYFLPDLGGEEGVMVRLDHLDPSRTFKLDPYVNITPSLGFGFQLSGIGGTRNTDPGFKSAPFTSRFELRINRSYWLTHSTSDGNFASRNVTVNMEVILTTYTSWPMEDIEYTMGETLWDIALDKAKEAAADLTKQLMNASRPIISDSMSSLKDIPPIVVDLMENGDLDLAEISRVATNISMDLSSSLREGVKGLIKELIEMGLTEILSNLCEIIGIERFEVRLTFGPIIMLLVTEKDGLLGEEGSIIELVFDIPFLGLHGYFGIDRNENGTIEFNGTVTMRKGLFNMRIELDPFMENRPHLLSLDGSYGKKNSSRTRISFFIPGLVEYRVSEVSLSTSLGVDPMVPIPPLGIQAVLDAGFRLRYRLPEELPPTLNEFGFSDGNLSWLEIFDPRLHPFDGSTIEIRDKLDNFQCSWLLRGSADPYSFFEFGDEDIWRWDVKPDLNERSHLILRSPSGLILDDVWFDTLEGDSVGRDNDGFGIWKWDDPTPASSNGGSRSISIKGLILSIAFSSIKESWEEAYSLFGLSIDTVVHFIQRSVELFMERFIALVSEIVIDVTFFMKLEIEDSSGSAGGGIELSLRANGDAIAKFLEWIYGNIRILIDNIKDPGHSGDLISFPLGILENCFISIKYFTEVETPVSVSDLAPGGTQIPDSLTLGFVGEINLALPMELIGKNIGSWHISFGIMVMEAPASIVSLFYDVSTFTSTTDLWLIKGEIWEE